MGPVSYLSKWISGSLFLLLFFIQTVAAQMNPDQFPVYNGTDLGVTYTAKSAYFRIWAPTATAVRMQLYREGMGGSALSVHALHEAGSGTWALELPGNYKGFFYTFQAMHAGRWSNEVPDPGARAVGINGLRGAIIDLQETHPPGWNRDRSPVYTHRKAATDAVIYELHIRDATMHASSGVQRKGGYAGLAERGTRNPEGLPTGLDHIRSLGVTHVHLLPFFDFRSVDEGKPLQDQYNWGYDPLNYNVPEGSYSSNPENPVTRIRELKEMIAAFHRSGLRVVMDVVYNHVADAAASSFEQLVPGYYFRRKPDGSFSDATACGNETASERPMMRKFMVESLAYWAREYHIDGFRFDLMGVHDIETMHQAAAVLKKMMPDILLYGEGWTAGASVLPESERALKKNASLLHHIAVFGDDLRDGIKGSVFDITDRGFASGKAGMEASIRFGVAGACDHPQVNYDAVNYSRKPYAGSPAQVISYCECHDNHTLFDKLMLSCKDATPAERAKMHQLALTIVLTSQGIPFLHAGTEMMRSKQGAENSYRSGDTVNALRWSSLGQQQPLVRYLRALIKMRKQHPAFRLTRASQVKRLLRFDDAAPAGTVVYELNGAAVHDSWKKIWVAYNGNATAKTLQLPAGKWMQAPGTGKLRGSQQGVVRLEGYSSVILYRL